MMRTRFCLCVLCALLSLAVAAALVLLEPPAVSAQAKGGPVSFINDVAPIFKENCFACHDAKKRKGKLDMSTYESLRKGGENEDPITPGKPKESLLIELLTTPTGSRMPPKEAGDPLPKDKIAVIERWIAEGAKLDNGIDAKADLMRELRLRWKPPQPPAQYQFPTIVNALAFTPDEKQVVVSGHHELTVWDIDSAKLVKRIHTRSERAYALAFLPDGKLVVAGGRPGQEGNVRVYDINGPGKEQDGVTILDGVNDKKVMLAELVDSDDAVLCLDITADGKKLAAGGCDRLVRVFDLSEGFDKAKLEQTIENHADWVFGVALTPDGKRLLTASRDKTAKVWDLEKKESILTFPDHQNGVYGVAVKPDGKVAYSVGEDKNVRSWNATENGKQVKAAAGHGQAVLKIVHHPKQPLLVTCGADNTVRTWNADSLAAAKNLTGHADHVFAIAVSPSGQLIASGSFNGEVRIWKTDDGSLVKAFNASPGLPQTAANTEPKK